MIDPKDFSDVPKDEFDYQVDADIEAERAYLLSEFVKEQNENILK